MCDSLEELMEKPILTGWKMIADYLGCHEQTAMRLGRSQGLPFLKADGLIFSSKLAINTWLLVRIVEQGNNE
jgi:hypothetical protein